jgi:hypothetical protein
MVRCRKSRTRTIESFVELRAMSFDRYASVGCEQKVELIEAVMHARIDDQLDRRTVDGECRIAVARQPVGPRDHRTVETAAAVQEDNGRNGPAPGGLAR